MFIDETIIEIQAGNGGNGCFAYERLKFIPKGPPAGGNGGRGGNIYIVGNSQLHTLQDSAYRKKYAADRGEHGSGKNQYGHNAKDMIIEVPLGTIVYEQETGRILFDCIQNGEKILAAKGGRGGKGNAALSNRKNPNPEVCEEGQPGEVKTIRLVLKVLADVGLVGRPNAGKSTFLSRISHAHPKIADYPFTTTEPHLGIVKSRDGYGGFIVADIPGLIEGSHTGKGLGIRFLKHIERTRVLAILVECTSEDIEADAQVLVDELTLYSAEMAQKPRIFVATKADILPIEDRKTLPTGWYLISSATGEGVRTLLDTFEKIVKENPVETTEPVDE